RMDAQLHGDAGRGDRGLSPRHRGGPRLRQSVQRHRGLPDREGPARRRDRMAGESDSRQAVREPRVPAFESGARLREEAGVGQGDRVLPARAEDQPQIRPGPARVRAAAVHDELKRVAPMGNKTILVAVNDVFFYTKLRDALKPHGYTFEKARTHGEVADKAGALRPAAVVLNINDEGLDAFKALEALKSDVRSKSIPVLAFANHEE